MSRHEDLNAGPVPGTAATYPVTIHLPAGARWPKDGDRAEIFVSVAHPNAAQAVMGAGINWSGYLRTYCKMQLEPIVLEHAVRGDEAVILGVTTLRPATTEGTPGE